MKKYLLCVVMLVLSAASFRTSWAEKVCGGSKGGYSLNETTGALTFDDACTSIVDLAFSGNNKIVSVDLSNTSISSIGDQEFIYCESLSSIKFPASLTSIGDEAFFGCTSITSSIDLSNTSVTSIGKDAFTGCHLIPSVLFPASLTTIEDYAFSECNTITSIDFSNTSLTTIGDSAFLQCRLLSSVMFPVSLTSIGEMAFSRCRNLTSIDLSNTSITSIGDWAFGELADPSTITVTKGSKAHELLGGLNSVTGDLIDPNYGENYTTLIVKEPPTPTPGTVSGSEDVIHVEPLPEDEYGSYRLDPVTGEKTYLLFHTYEICMNFLNNDALCSGYDRCYHK